MDARTLGLSVIFTAALTAALSAGCASSVEGGPAVATESTENVGSTKDPLRKCDPGDVQCLDQFGVPFIPGLCSQPVCCVQGGGWDTIDSTVQGFEAKLQSSACAAPKAYSKSSSTTWNVYTSCPTAAAKAILAEYQNVWPMEPVGITGDISCVGLPAAGTEFIVYDPGCPGCSARPQ